MKIIIKIIFHSEMVTHAVSEHALQQEGHQFDSWGFGIFLSFPPQSKPCSWPCVPNQVATKFVPKYCLTDVNTFYLLLLYSKNISLTSFSF